MITWGEATKVRRGAMVHLYLEKDDSDPSSGFNLKEFFTRDPSSAATLLEGKFLSPNGNNLETLGKRRVVTFFFCKLYLSNYRRSTERGFFFFLNLLLLLQLTPQRRKASNLQIRINFFDVIHKLTFQVIPHLWFVN